LFEVIVVNVLAVFFAFISRYKDFRHGLKISFILIFIFLALRYNFGNDYQAYHNNFLIINNYDSINYFNKSFQLEPGWLFLCRLFKPIGFFGMVMILALFNCVVYYRFINKYLPPQYYWLAVTIYLFDPSFMLIQASAMRQSLAIAIFIASIPYIYKKDPIRYIIGIGVAWFFHSSALILLPLYFLGYVNWKINKITGAVILASFISLYLFGKNLAPYVNQFIQSNFERYDVYQGGAVIGTGFGIFYFSIFFILILAYERYQNKETSLLFKIAIVGFMIIPFGLIIQLIGRVGMYLGPSAIIVYPVILMKIKRPVYKTMFLVFYLFFASYLFFQFFTSQVYKDAFGNYQTIFSAPQIN